MRRIRAGLIGCGSVSIIGILPQLDEPDAREWLELVAVCDVVEARAQEVARRYRVPHVYTEAAELIARDDIELVLVITPIPLHYRYTMQALTAGKHVYVQKTMATTYAEAREMVEAARQRGLTLVAAPGQMLAPSMQHMRRLVQEGALGKVYWAWGNTGGWGHDFEWTRHGDDPLTTVDPTWYYKAGGGPQVDVTVYVLHSLTGILGPARQVTAMSGTAVGERYWRDKRISMEVDDNTLLLLDFGGATFGFAGGHSSMTGRLIEWGGMGIYGAEGVIETLEVEPLSGHPSRLFLRSRHPLPELAESTNGEWLPPGDLPYVTPAHAAIPEPHVYSDIMHCVECIVEGKPPIASGEHAAHVVEIIEKGYIAARTGTTQTLESTFEAHPRLTKERN
jgi:predicted dehydrogenase